ncbi:ABC transporter ATP-binding protein [Nesterenkonia sp. NBAIMH1]|uniref:ABC transporter ATP-binding protein n=1 Tax=Nesterenkonia sp. NBAIMH1 TaxID=2600320 RepID=UPI00143D8DED|nr:ABC transporter ATP-binding protein [Nesterenkonia sp. NBAIMH1]
MSRVQLQDIRKSFPSRAGEVEVLRGIDVTVEDGEFLAILGPSGCGKSTLLRLISGLELASGGSMSIDGTDITGTAPEKRELAMVFQNYALFPHLNVRENILFGLKSRGAEKSLRSERLAEAAELLGLEELLDRKPSELSGGQRQRVALGRALVSGQRLVLMDEPLSNLDAKLRAEMRVELKRIQRRLGLTIIYVTHDQVEAMTMADRVLMMSEGRVEQLAPPEEIYSAPATVTVGRFIGSPPMNIVDVPADSDLAHLLPEELRASGAALGVRPESVELHAAGEAVPGDRVRLAGAEVLVNELLGADRIISTALESSTSASTAGRRITARLEPGRRIDVEEHVSLSAKAADLHWYSPSDGTRMTPTALQAA